MVCVVILDHTQLKIIHTQISSVAIFSKPVNTRRACSIAMLTGFVHHLATTWLQLPPTI